MTSQSNRSLSHLREQWSDPLLTSLTILLILMLFVFAPLQALGSQTFQVLGFASALGLIAGAFFMSGNPVIAVGLLAAFIMAGTAAVSRLNAQSTLDIYLFAGALFILGTTLAYVAARAVFAPGRVLLSSNYWRDPGLSERRCDLYGAIHDCRNAISAGVFWNGAGGQSGPRQQRDLFQLCDINVDRLWRYLSCKSRSAQPLQSRNYHWSTLSCHFAGEAGIAGN
jgi:hypothetical protein